MLMYKLCLFVQVPFSDALISDLDFRVTLTPPSTLSRDILPRMPREKKLTVRSLFSNHGNSKLSHSDQTFLGDDDSSRDSGFGDCDQVRTFMSNVNLTNLYNILNK